MDKRLKNQMRKMLLEEKEKFRIHLVESEKILKRVANGERADVDRGIPDCHGIIQINGKRVTSLRRCLEKFDGALKRLELDTYGICEECDEQISLGRLKSVPFANLCTLCKIERKEVEKKRKLA